MNKQPRVRMDRQSGALSKVMNNGKEIRLFMKVLDAERDDGDGVKTCRGE